MFSWEVLAFTKPQPFENQKTATTTTCGSFLTSVQLAKTQLRDMTSVSDSILGSTLLLFMDEAAQWWRYSCDK